MRALNEAARRFDRDQTTTASGENGTGEKRSLGGQRTKNRRVPVSMVQQQRQLCWGIRACRFPCNSGTHVRYRPSGVKPRCWPALLFLLLDGRARSTSTFPSIFAMVFTLSFVWLLFLKRLMFSLPAVVCALAVPITGGILCRQVSRAIVLTRTMECCCLLLCYSPRHRVSYRIAGPAGPRGDFLHEKKSTS